MPQFILISVYITLRNLFYGWPVDQEVYQIKFGKNIFLNLIKYVQWSLNITGISSEIRLLNYIYYLLIGCFLLICLLGIIRILKKGSNLNILFLGLFWWIISLSPVLFLKSHLDSWNLLSAALGSAIILGLIFNYIPRFYMLGTNRPE